MMCASLIFIVLAESPQDSRELRVRFVRGEEYRLSESQTVLREHEDLLEGKRWESRVRREIVQNWKVVEVGSDGSAEIAIESTRVRVERDGTTVAELASWPADAGKLLVTLGEDSDIVCLAYRWYGAELADAVAFLGPGCRFRVTHRGEITRVQGLEALRIEYRERATKLTSTPAERMTLDVRMWHLLSEPHVRAALSLWFVPCPDRPIRDSGEWTTSIRLPTEIAEAEGQTTHRLRTGERSLEISSQGTWKLTSKSKSVSLRSTRAEVSTRSVVDPQSCWVRGRSHDSRTEVEIQVSLDSGPEAIRRVRSETTSKGTLERTRSAEPTSKDPENPLEAVRVLMGKKKWRSAYERVQPLLDRKDPPKEALAAAEECVNRGSLLAFLTDVRFSVSVGRPDGKEIRLIVPKRDWGWGYYAPVWSPDGRTLAYTYHGDQGNEVRVASRAGSDDRILVPSRTAWSGLTWSPDGRTILFSGFTPGKEGGSLVWSVDADGKNLRAWSKEEGEAPDWSPDGKAVVCRGPSYQLYLLDPQGKSVKKFTSGDRPRWSPDGRRIAFLYISEGLKVMNADGTDAQVIVGSDQEPSYLCWSPDGRRIAYSTQKREIFILTLATGERKAVHSGAEPHWSAILDED